MIPEKEEICHINGTKRTCKIYLFIYFFGEGHGRFVMIAMVFRVNHLSHIIYILTC